MSPAYTPVANLDFGYLQLGCRQTTEFFFGFLILDARVIITNYLVAVRLIDCSLVCYGELNIEQVNG